MFTFISLPELKTLDPGDIISLVFESKLPNCTFPCRSIIWEGTDRVRSGRFSVLCLTYIYIYTKCTIDVPFDGRVLLFLDLVLSTALETPSTYSMLFLPHYLNVRGNIFSIY